MSTAKLELYGLKTCDTCRKARRALESAGHDVIFIDVRDEPVNPAQTEAWLAHFGPALLNTRSTTWRGLDESVKENTPLELLSAHPTLMKRPVIAQDGTLYLGWTKPVQDVLL